MKRLTGNGVERAGGVQIRSGVYGPFCRRESYEIEGTRSREKAKAMMKCGDKEAHALQDFVHNTRRNASIDVLAVIGRFHWASPSGNGGIADTADVWMVTAMTTC